MSDFINLCEAFRENKRLIEELAAENENIRMRILDIMQNKEIYIEGVYKATNKPITQKRLDSKAIEREEPEIYQKYIKESRYNRFTIS